MDQRALFGRAGVYVVVATDEVIGARLDVATICSYADYAF